jgi:hypothetical protein
MNMVANQTGAGVSLINGPMVAARGEAIMLEAIRAELERFRTRDAQVDCPLCLEQLGQFGFFFNRTFKYFFQKSSFSRKNAFLMACFLDNVTIVMKMKTQQVCDQIP